MRTSSSFGYEESDKGVVAMEDGGCEGRQEPCDPVASEGTKHIDNGHSPLGSV